MRVTAVTILAVWWVPLAASAQVPFTDDFDNGRIQADWREGTCCTHSLDVVSAPSPVRAGANAVRFELRRGDPNVDLGKRSELSLDRLDPRGEYWYGFSLFLPADYETDNSPEIVAQWHGYPDMSEGENWRSPPLALMTRRGQWRIARRHDARRITPGNGNDNLVSEDLGAYERGRWTDFAFHVRWSWTGDGVLEVFRDGALIYEHSGSIGFNDAEGPYLKVGIYKWDWSEGSPSDTNVRTLYVDEIRVRGGDGSLAAVSPSGGSNVDAGVPSPDAGRPPLGDAGNSGTDAGAPPGQDGGGPVRDAGSTGGSEVQDAGRLSRDAGSPSITPPSADAPSAISGGCHAASRPLHQETPALILATLVGLAVFRRR